MGVHCTVQKCAKSCLKMSKMEILGFFGGGGRDKWMGVAEHTLAHPHVKFEHDKAFN